MNQRSPVTPPAMPAHDASRVNRPTCTCTPADTDVERVINHEKNTQKTNRPPTDPAYQENHIHQKGDAQTGSGAADRHGSIGQKREHRARRDAAGHGIHEFVATRRIHRQREGNAIRHAPGRHLSQDVVSTPTVRPIPGKAGVATRICVLQHEYTNKFSLTNRRAKGRH